MLRKFYEWLLSLGEPKPMKFEYKPITIFKVEDNTIPKPKYVPPARTPAVQPSARVTKTALHQAPAVQHQSDNNNDLIMDLIIANALSNVEHASPSADEESA